MRGLAANAHARSSVISPFDRGVSRSVRGPPLRSHSGGGRSTAASIVRLASAGLTAGSRSRRGSSRGRAPGPSQAAGVFWRLNAGSSWARFSVPVMPSVALLGSGTGLPRRRSDPALLHGPTCETNCASRNRCRPRLRTLIGRSGHRPARAGSTDHPVRMLRRADALRGSGPAAAGARRAGRGLPGPGRPPGPCRAPGGR